MNTFVYLQEMCFCSSNTVENRNKKQNGSLYSKQLWKRQIMSPLEQRAGLFIAQYNKDNDTLWGKGQTLLSIVHILGS